MTMHLSRGLFFLVLPALLPGLRGIATPSAAAGLIDEEIECSSHHGGGLVRPLTKSLTGQAEHLANKNRRPLNPPSRRCDKHFGPISDGK